MFVLLTQSTTFIIGPIAQLFGVILDAIYNFFYNSFGIESLGASIITFTLLIKVALLPLTIKQQKSMKEQQKIQPEMKRIQDKYKNKKDEASQKKQQEELSALYKEHGVNPLGGCLPLLIQMPILFALFRVLRNIPAYITQVKDVYSGIIAGITQVDGYEKVLETYLETKTVSDYDVTDSDKIIDLLSQLTNSEWLGFKETFSSISDMISPLIDNLYDINNFLTINLTDVPVSGIENILSVGTLIPILCLASQILVTRLTMSRNQNSGTNTAQDQSQKTMMYMMPLITVFFVVSMPAGLGLYWLVSNIFQLLQQLLINRVIHNDDDNTGNKNLKAKTK